MWKVRGFRYLLFLDKEKGLMFKFSREGTRVKITVTASIPNDCTRDFFCYWETNAEWAAGLLVQLFNKTLSERVSASKQFFYNQGWADAKAKRQKEIWFSPWLEQE